MELSGGTPIAKRNAPSDLEIRIPIGSAILGSLMPKKQYKYIPLSIFNNLEIEILLSKHATICLNPYNIVNSGT